MTSKYFQPDEIIYRKGDLSNEIFFIIKGVIEISSLSQEGNEYIFSLESAQSFCGELGFLDGKPRDTNATAKTYVEVVTLRRSDFVNIMSQMSTLSWLNLIYFLCEKNRTLKNEIENLSLSSPEARLSSKLIELCEKKLKKTDLYVLSISQEELAFMVGATRESVSKYLSKLENDRLIVKSRGSITINSLGELKRYSEEYGSN